MTEDHNLRLADEAAAVSEILNGMSVALLSLAESRFCRPEVMAFMAFTADTLSKRLAAADKAQQKEFLKVAA